MFLGRKTTTNKQGSIKFKVIGLTQPGFENARFGFFDLPKRAMDGCSTHSAIPSGRVVMAMKMGNIAPRAGTEPALLAFQAP